MKSNFPVSTVMMYTNFAFSTIHFMGNNPYNAPSPAAANASFNGLLNTRIARPSAEANPATAATGARTCQTRRSAQHHNGKGGDQHGNTPVLSTETRWVPSTEIPRCPARKHLGAQHGNTPGAQRS